MPQTPAPQLQLTQHESRSLLVPALLAILLLAVALLLARYFFPATTIDIDHLHTDILATKTTMKADTIVIGANESTQSLYVVSNIRITNKHPTSVYLDDLTLTYTDPTGAELVTRAVQKPDLASIETSYPALKTLDPHPLFRETEIAPGKSAEGTILFSMPIPQSQWDGRQSAVIKADIYHLNPVYATIPK